MEANGQIMYRLLDLWLARRDREGWEKRAEALRQRLAAMIDEGSEER